MKYNSEAPTTNGHTKYALELAYDLHGDFLGIVDSLMLWTGHHFDYWVNKQEDKTVVYNANIGCYIISKCGFPTEIYEPVFTHELICVGYRRIT